MIELLRSYARFVVRHAWLVLGVSLLASLVLAAGITKLAIELDPDGQLPADHPYIVIDKKIRKEFGGKQFVAIALVPRSGDVWTKDVLGKVHALTAEVLDLPGVIRQNVVSLSSPYVRIPVDRGGALTVDYLMRDVPADDAAVAEIRDRYRGEPLFKGTVVSNDERAALVLADFFDDVKPEAIAAEIHRLADKYGSADLTVAATGQPLFEDQERVMVAAQSRYFGGTVSAILVVLFLAFGQIQGVVLPTATALLSTACSLGFMGWAGIPMNSWTAAVPLMVVTVAAGHSAQMLKRYYEEFRRLGDRGAAVVESTSRIGVVMMGAGLTAGCGFAALAILGIPTLAHFGIGIACGILAAIVLEMTFMLALRVIWPTGRAHGGEGPLSRWLGLALVPLESAVVRRPKAVVAAFGLVAVAALSVSPWLSTEMNARKYWSDETQIGRDLRLFEKHFPSTTTVSVLLEGAPGSMKTARALEVMSGLQQAMAAEPGVGRTSSIADVIRRTYEVFAPEEAAKGPPATDDLVGQLFFLGESPAFERFVDRAYSRAVVLGYLDRDDSALTRRVLDRLQGYAAAHPSPEIHVSIAGGAGPTVLALNDDTVRGKALNIVIVLLVIFAIASVLLRTPTGGAYVAAPLVMALAVNIGLFSWFEVAFDVAGASIAAIGVGIGADYAIYFLYRLREEFRLTGNIDDALTRAMETSGRAVLFVALAISSGFGIYATADFYSFHVVGVFVPMTMIVSCLTAITLLPALVLLLRPRFIFESAKVAADPAESLLRAAGSR